MAIPAERAAGALSAVGTTPRSVTILGSTGSIGCNTVDLLERNPGRYRVEALTASGNVERLAEQARRLNARLAVTADERRYLDLKAALSGTGIRVAAGPESLIEAASLQIGRAHV